MRFVSDIRGLTITVKAGTPEVRDPGTGQITRAAVEDLEAKFSHDLLDEAASRQAWLPRSQGGLANTDRREDGSVPDSPFRGLQQDESGKFLPAEIRFAVFDTEIAALQLGWSKDVKEAVEQALLSRAGAQFVLVPDVLPTKPWNGYDSVSDPEKIIEVAGLIEANLEAVLVYEKANQDRPDVVSALEEAISLADEADVIVNA